MARELGVILGDKQWAKIVDQPCKVTSFTPLAKLEGEKVIVFDATQPYAFVGIECPMLPSNSVGAIAHKLDFKNLAAAIETRGDGDEEEVIIFWVKKPRKWPASLLSLFMPSLVIMLCKEGAYELISDRSSRPDLTGEARFRALAPIVQWKPDAKGCLQGPYFDEDIESRGAARRPVPTTMKEAAIQRAYAAVEGEEVPEEIQTLLDRLD